MALSALGVTAVAGPSQRVKVLWLLALNFCAYYLCRGNGFITDQSILKAVGLSDPTSFFTTMLGKPWLNQVHTNPQSPETLLTRSLHTSLSIKGKNSKEDAASTAWLTTYCSGCAGCVGSPHLLPRGLRRNRLLLWPVNV